MYKQFCRHVSFASPGTWYSKLVKPRSTKPPYGHVVQIGDPVLRTSAASVQQKDIHESREIHLVIQTLKKTFHKYECIGLSAPQIGVPLSIFLMEFSKKHMKIYTNADVVAKEMSLLPFTVAINPKLKVIGYSRVIFPESCESIRGFWADVPRFHAVEVEAFNENGEAFKMSLKGWSARIAQHEMDHLNGKMYTDIMDSKSLTCSCWQTVNERRGKVMLPFGSK